MPLLPKRYLTDLIKEDLSQKMVFIGGPRQVGKATLSQSLIKKYKDGHPAYLNWDSDLDRRKIKNRIWPANERLIVFDEIHKFRGLRLNAFNIVSIHFL